MPYKSKSQMKRFYAMEERGELKKGTAERWTKETPNIKSLPMRIKKKNGGTVKSKMSKYKLADGGPVGDQDDKKKKAATPPTRTGTGEDKSKTKVGDLTQYKGSDPGEVTVNGKPYSGKLYSAKPEPSYRNSTSTKNKLNKGGLVIGKGTGTSDSNPGKIKKGSFIIPSKVREKLKEILTDKKANMDQKDGEEVELSKGEEVVDEKEAKKTDKLMKKNGIKKGINSLAPNSKVKFSRKMFVKNKK